MGRHSAGASGRGRREPRVGASRSHRSGPARTGPLAALAHLLVSTTPRRVSPPRFYRVLFASGLVVGLVLFAYSTTQVYLHFTDPQEEASRPQSEPVEQMPTQPSSGAAGSEGPGMSPEHAASGASAVPADITFHAQANRSGAFTGEITIRNTGEEALQDWDLELTFTESQVVAVWGAEWEPKPDGAHITPSDAEAPIAPGDSRTVQFDAEGSVETPRCLFSGSRCELGS